MKYFGFIRTNLKRIVLRKYFFVAFYIVILAFCLFSSKLYAGVDVFDSNRGKPPKAVLKKTPPKKVRPKPKVRKKKIDVVFVGSSHIDSMMLYFKDKQNKQIAVEFNTEKEVFLPGYDDLVIEKMENRVLYVKDVNNKYCANDEKRGIVCLPEKGVIEMKLVRKFVAQPKQKIKPKSKSVKNKGVVRIDPKDVPAGKRLVKTPFGDRIVPK